MKRMAYLIAMGLLLLMVAGPGEAWAQEKGKPQGPPPAPVVTAKSTTGMVHPMIEFVGTVYYPEVSKVASEVDGRVDAVFFEEGRHVGQGRILVRLGADLMQKRLVSAQADHDKILADLENARIDNTRMEALFKAQTVSEREYDEARFKRQGLEMAAAAKQAEAERLQLEIEKKAIRTPFAGIVLEKLVSRGEWLSPGSGVAILARDDYVDVVVEVPQEILPFVRPDLEVEVVVGGRSVKGEVYAVIPMGDVATRTFPVKVRVRNVADLAQGMEGRVLLPSGERIESVIVPRDAVIRSRGQYVVYVVKDNAAQMTPVEVTAYMGLEAAVQGAGLVPGLDVVVKGNERLRPGQAVMAAPAAQ